MGYDLHATRAKHWSKSAARQIPAATWLGLVSRDPDLRPDGANGPHAVIWTDAAGATRGWFDWHAGAVYTTNPNQASVGKLLEIAAHLQARVQGDSGEFYETAEDWQQ